MALYDPVDGVYRQVTKKYDPVDGVYRNVTKAYDPVDGVYREYFSSGLKWAKYECDYTWKLSIDQEYGDLVEEEISEEEYQLGNSGYKGYDIKYEYYPTERAYYAPTGEICTWTGMMLYNISADGQVCTGVSVRIDSLGSSTGYERATRVHRILRTYRYYYYEVGDAIGYVRAAEGEYPDAKNGYTYVTTYQGYTIMQDPDTGDYYAYLLEEE